LQLLIDGDSCRRRKAALQLRLAPAKSLLNIYVPKQQQAQAPVPNLYSPIVSGAKAAIVRRDLNCRPQGQTSPAAT
jgi:hypothetical protein